MSWGWRKLLQLREIMKPFFWVKLGNGLSTSMWYDRWSDSCPLINLLSPRDIAREGFHLKNKVVALLMNGSWAWPQSWLHKAPDLGIIPAPFLDISVPDKRQWRDRSGNVMDFSVAKAWEAIRNRGNQVEWTFKNIRRSPEEIRDIIMVTVRLKLITFRFKNLESEMAEEDALLAFPHECGNVESSKELWDSLEAKYMLEDASSKKFLVSNFINYKMTDSIPVMEQYNKLLGILGRFTQHKINMDKAIQDSDKPKSNNVAGPLAVNMVEHNNSIRYNDNKGKRKHQDTKVDPNKKSKDDDVAWWVDSGTTIHVCKDRCWFKIYESLNDGSILHMRNESTSLVHRRGCVDLRFSSGKIIFLFNVLHVPNIRKNLVSSIVLNNYGYKQVIESNKFVLSKHGVFIGFGYLSNQMFRLNIVNNNIGSAFMSTSKLNDSILWHAGLGQTHYKRMQDIYKDGLILYFDMDTEKYEALDKFEVFKTEVELQQGAMIKRFRTDREWD
ncbi:zinc finger, CCHC-type containing protein [Tanacetum coccineum]|uniref:Zinc finger, CCHC-type containing protein n=1 Tax=Tanacetum coccineum TaxID=301880 RepID=A0ABQ4YDQ7_9ASTR